MDPLRASRRTEWPVVVIAQLIVGLIALIGLVLNRFMADNIYFAENTAIK